MSGLDTAVRSQGVMGEVAVAVALAVAALDLRRRGLPLLETEARGEELGERISTTEIRGNLIFILDWNLEQQ